jgi:hypothetical protein
MEYIIIPLIAAALITAIILIIKKSGRTEAEDGMEKAGRDGEKYAVQVIRSVMRRGDALLTNVHVSYGGRETELDNVIVNGGGVYIVEVKSYKGRLEGREDDFNWTQYRTDGKGGKTVKNPIKQVKRQIYITSKYLRQHGAPKVSVDGFAILVYSESPAESRYILKSTAKIDKAIHAKTSKALSRAEKEAVVGILEAAITDK